MKLSRFDAQIISLKEKVEMLMNKKSKEKVQEILNKNNNKKHMEKLRYNELSQMWKS